MAEDFLRRWSRLKHEHAAEPEKPLEKKEDAAAAKPAAPLPALDKLSPDSDFTGFMQPKVEDALRRAALKTLFRDPHFNIPDPFEPYSGDWTGEVLSPELLATLKQADTLLFDKQYAPKPEQAKSEDESEEKSEANSEEKTIEKNADEPRRQDA